MGPLFVAPGDSILDPPLVECRVGERVVYRELSFRGLTLLDLSADQVSSGSRASFARAREEVAELIDTVATAAGAISAAGSGWDCRFGSLGAGDE
jgi:hypothetical protein